MLAEKSFIKISKAAIPAIAGQHSGKRVLCQDNDVLTAYNQLAQLARSGNHWARISINGIQSLSAGRLHQNNVFVRKDAPLANGRGRFFMILPGIRATFEDLDNGTLMLVGLQLDANYKDLQNSQHRPALYRVDDHAESIELIRECTITPRDGRPVVICDATPESPEKVAQSIIGFVKGHNSSAAKHVQAFGFDLHYTPGTKGITGLKSVRSMLSTKGNHAVAESSTMLANAMHQARDIHGVTWMSSFGGSAILTQALQILHNESKVKPKYHSIYLHHSTSNSRLAFSLAKNLGMSPSEKKTGLGLREVTGNHLPTLLSKSKLTNIADNGLDTLSATSSLVAPLAAPLAALGVGVGILGSPLIGVAAGGLFFVKAAIATKKKIVKTNYK
jgi:hypothetical protein